MEIRSKTIATYKTPEGKDIFKEWFYSLNDRVAKVNIFERFNRIRLGNLGDCKSVGDNIFEVRIRFGPGYRIYFGELSGVTLILLCGGTKSSQSKDIKKAKEYWLEFKKRKT